MTNATSPPEPQEKVTIEVTLNGEQIERRVRADMLLSTFLRTEEFLTGTHRGCESTKCGACTVLIDGTPVKSCNQLAVQIDDREVTTIEGLAADDGGLHPVQKAFWDTHGLQCGFCTPGMILTATALLETNPEPNTEEIQKYLSGNICRCTGYTKIVQSVKSATMDDD